MKKIALTVMVVLGAIFANLSFGQNQKLPFGKASNKDGSMYHIKEDGTPLYGSLEKLITFEEINDFKIVCGDTICIIIDDNGLSRIINTKGQYIFPLAFESISEFDSSGYAIASNEFGKFPIHIKKGRLNGKNHKDVQPFEDGLAIVTDKLKEIEMYFIDSTGNKPASWPKEKYKEVRPFTYDCAWIKKKDGYFYLVNKKGITELNSNKYDKVNPVANQKGKFVAEINNVLFEITIFENNEIKMVIATNSKEKKDKIDKKG
ncbi:MAG: WG repeat-containing protein [Candidatus Paceibacterota bacterium]|jgi:hypothetical protein